MYLARDPAADGRSDASCVDVDERQALLSEASLILYAQLLGHTRD